MSAPRFVHRNHDVRSSAARRVEDREDALETHERVIDGPKQRRGHRRARELREAEARARDLFGVRVRVHHNANTRRRRDAGWQHRDDGIEHRVLRGFHDRIQKPAAVAQHRLGLRSAESRAGARSDDDECDGIRPFGHACACSRPSRVRSIARLSSAADCTTLYPFFESGTASYSARSASASALSSSSTPLATSSSTDWFTRYGAGDTPPSTSRTSPSVRLMPGERDEREIPRAALHQFLVSLRAAGRARRKLDRLDRSRLAPAPSRRADPSLRCAKNAPIGTLRRESFAPSRSTLASSAVSATAGSDGCTAWQGLRRESRGTGSRRATAGHPSPPFFRHGTPSPKVPAVRTLAEVARDRAHVAQRGRAHAGGGSRRAPENARE